MQCDACVKSSARAADGRSGRAINALGRTAKPAMCNTMQTAATPWCTNGSISSDLQASRTCNEPGTTSALSSASGKHGHLQSSAGHLAIWQAETVSRCLAGTQLQRHKAKASLHANRRRRNGQEARTQSVVADAESMAPDGSFYVPCCGGAVAEARTADEMAAPSKRSSR